MLVKRGADPTLTDDSGRIAADMTDDEELAKWLRYGSNVSLTQSLGPATIFLRARSSRRGALPI